MNYWDEVAKIQRDLRREQRHLDPFLAILDEIQVLHDRKRQDYGVDEDPLANVRASQDFGVDPWLGAVIRANDKVQRLKTYARKRALANESVEDSLLDLAVYAVIALQLFREEHPSP